MASDQAESRKYILMAAENLRKAQEASDCGFCRKLIGEQENAIGRLSALMQQAEEYMALQQEIEEELQGMEKGARASMRNAGIGRDDGNGRGGRMQFAGGFRDMFQNRMRLVDIINIGGRR